MKELLIGIDLGGTNVKLGLVDVDGNIIASRSFPTQVEQGPQDLIERIAHHSFDLLQKYKYSIDRVLCAGIGSPGPLSVDQGQLYKCANLPGYDNFKMRAKLSKALKKPAVLHNDANAACWGEFWMGTGRNVTDMVMFTLGTGIGGGIIYNGELIRGSDDNGAELGHIIIIHNGRLCNCGQKGCIEAYASANQTALRAEEAIRNNPTSTLKTIWDTNGKLTCKDVFDHAINGDPTAKRITEETAQYLALICVNMLHTTEPQLVVFAGGMIEAGNYLLDMIRSYFKELVWNLKPEPMAIEYASLGGDAGFVGAAGLALHTMKQGQTIASR